ncbi:hypothetical protein VTO42DRAFT_1450 [Malbranchea cinnamomea]
MRGTSAFLSLAGVLFAPLIVAQQEPPGGEDPLRVFTISAPGITASFIPFGARLTSLLVQDRNGHPQDIVVGFDDPQQYVDDVNAKNNYFGCVVGRYANRIKNGTFVVDNVAYQTPKNEFGIQTLHGGDVGYDQRNWTVTALTPNSITFTLFDPGFEGFPGSVITHATYSVNSSTNPNGPIPRTQLTTKTVSIALTGATPIMLSNHIYWNLNAFKAPTVLNDTTLQMPLSRRFVETDSALIPTGQIGDVTTAFNGALDFTQPKLLGRDLQLAEGACGAGCTGYDNCFIIDRPTDVTDWTSSPDIVVPMLTMNSSITGIHMQVSTNQRAVQIYGCSGMNGAIPVKASQVQRNQLEGGNRTPPVDTIQQYGCVVVEPEGWIDGINNPEWAQVPFQVFSPETGPAVNWATYVFGAQ